jgi:hypothetical protein
MKEEGTEIQMKYDASLKFRVTCGDMPIVPSLMTTLLQVWGQRWIAEAAILMRGLQSDYFASSFQFLLETQLLVSAVGGVSGLGGQKEIARESITGYSSHPNCLGSPPHPTRIRNFWESVANHKFHRGSGGW